MKNSLIARVASFAITLVCISAALAPHDARSQASQQRAAPAEAQHAAPPQPKFDGAAQAGFEGDITVRALRDEMTRSMKDLRLAQLEQPYFIAYRVRNTQSIGVSASRGSLLTSGSSLSRNLGVDLRVGDYAFDNTNFVPGAEGLGFLMNRHFGEFNELPLDDNYAEIRRQVWLATDATYKQALENLAGKRAALQNKTRTDNLPDFSKEDPTKTVDIPPPVILRRSDAEAIVRNLSKVLSDMPDLYASSVSMNITNSNSVYINSEGTFYVVSPALITISASASTQAADGMPLGNSMTLYWRSLKSFPAREQLVAHIVELGAGLEVARKAALLDRYNGPVLFEGRAAAEVFSEDFASALVGQRKSISGSPEMAAVFERFAEHGGVSFTNKLGARVLPEFLSLVDNPTISEFDGQSLFGGYKVDEEGVPARETHLIENGILKTFLTTRTPVEGVAHSTGNSRGGSGSPSNLILKSESGLTDSQLKEKLLDLVKKRSLEFGIIVREIGGSGATMEEQAMAMVSAMTGQGESGRSVLVAFKVYPDGHEEPIRGARISGLNAGSFKDIVAASKSETVYTSTSTPQFNIGMISTFAAGNFSMPISTYVVPSLLFDDLTLTKPTGELPKPPFSSPPSAK